MYTCILFLYALKCYLYACINRFTEEKESKADSKAGFLNMTHQDSEIWFAYTFTERIKVFFQIVGAVTKVTPQRKHGKGEHVLPENLKKIILFG